MTGSSGPGPTEPTETFRFSSADGSALYGEYFAVSGPGPVPGVALILHGYAEHGGRYREVAHVLNQAGLPALAFDFRGHGRAAGQRGHTERFEHYLDDVQAALNELFRRTGEQPVLLLSHSHGGLVALRLLSDVERCPPSVRAAVLSSPFLGLKLAVSPVKKLVARIAGRALPTLSLPNQIEPEQLTSDPAKQAERRVDTLCHDVASARWYTEVLTSWDWVRTFASRIQVPTLWLVAGADEVVDAGASRDIQGRLRAPVSFHELEDFKHEVFNERDRSRAFDLLINFVAEQFPKR